MNPKLMKSRIMSNTNTVHVPLFFVIGFFEGIMRNMRCNQI